MRFQSNYIIIIIFDVYIYNVLNLLKAVINNKKFEKLAVIVANYNV